MDRDWQLNTIIVYIMHFFKTLHLCYTKLNSIIIKFFLLSYNWKAAYFLFNFNNITTQMMVPKVVSFLSRVLRLGQTKLGRGWLQFVFGTFCFSLSLALFLSSLRRFFFSLGNRKKEWREKHIVTAQAPTNEIYTLNNSARRWSCEWATFQNSDMRQKREFNEKKKRTGILPNSIRDNN